MEFAGGGGVIAFHDESPAKRRKVFARTVPLHDLDARKGYDGAGYQMAEIALQAIDQVTVAMDFDRGADHKDVVNRCCRSSPPRRPVGIAQSMPGWRGIAEAHPQHRLRASLVGAASDSR